METSTALIITFLLSQWIIVIITFLTDDNNDFFKSKKELLLWLIPVYMPIVSLYKMIGNKFNELK